MFVVAKTWTIRMFVEEIKAQQCTKTLWNHEGMYPKKARKFTQCRASNVPLLSGCDVALECEILLWEFKAATAQFCGVPARAFTQIVATSWSSTWTNTKFTRFPLQSGTNSKTFRIGSFGKCAVVVKRTVWANAYVEKTFGGRALLCWIPGIWINRKVGLLQDGRRYWWLLESNWPTLVGSERAPTHGLGCWEKPKHSWISSRWK